MLNGESRFGAELDSLSDVIAFGATPALIIYSWVLAEMPRFGWTISVFFVLCAALRLARCAAMRRSLPYEKDIVIASGSDATVPSRTIFPFSSTIQIDVSFSDTSSPT